MRILLQQTDNGLYLQESGAWKRSAKEARNFLSSAQAIEFCRANRCENTHLVLKFDYHGYDLVLSICATNRSSASSGEKAAHV